MSNFFSLNKKISDWTEAAEKVKQWQANGGKVVFTNGCFDILHFGHLRYLSEAGDLGDKLIIGLNSDASVKRLKGRTRPVHDIATRTHMLAAIGFVDLVVVFDQDTPLELIRKLNPNVLVKGGDWPEELIVGADHVKSAGGEVFCLSFVEGYSSTAIEQKIIDGYLSESTE